MRPHTLSTLCLVPLLLLVHCTGVPTPCGGSICSPSQKCVSGACIKACTDLTDCLPDGHCEDGACQPGLPGASSSGGSGSSGVSSTGSSGASGAVSGSGGDGGMGGMRSLGQACAANAECASNQCRQVYVDSADKVCTSFCTQPSACDANPNYHCTAPSAGVAPGLCLPRSPTLCRSCSNNADCGLFAEVCGRPSGESEDICMVDCELAGDATCPPDYQCTLVDLGGTNRRVCRPRTGSCADNMGGFCDVINVTTPCRVSNESGQCDGQRVCNMSGNRYDPCTADTPTCLASCTDLPPQGCALNPCPGAVNTVDRCGSCTRQCEGAGQDNTTVTCQMADCTFACQGEHYDVNNTRADGCELGDTPMGNHNAAGATFVGTYPCQDGSSMLSGSGHLPSDQRTHEPAVMFNVSGSAPDWFTIRATGGLTCINDVVISLTATGSSVPYCFKVTATTNNDTFDCVTASDGTCTLDSGSGGYSGDTDIVVVVEKTCTSAAPENPQYTLTGHL